MHPRMIRFESYQQAIQWLAERYTYLDWIHNNPKKLSWKKYKKNKQQKIAEIFNDIMYQEQSKERRKEVILTDLLRGGDNFYTENHQNPHAQKLRYTSFWTKYNQNYNQGDSCGSPLTTIGFITNSHDGLLSIGRNCSFLNDKQQHAGVRFNIAETDPSRFFIALHHNEFEFSSNGVTIIFSNNYYCEQVDNHYNVHSLKTIDELNKAFFQNLCLRSAQNKLIGLFTTETKEKSPKNKKIQLNMSVVEEFIEKHTTRFKNEDFQWEINNFKSRKNIYFEPPTLFASITNFFGRMLTAGIEGAAVGLTLALVAVVFGVLTIGFGFIACIGAGLLLGAAFGVYEAIKNPAPSKKILIPSTDDLGHKNHESKEIPISERTKKNLAKNNNDHVIDTPTPRETTFVGQSISETSKVSEPTPKEKKLSLDPQKVHDNNLQAPPLSTSPKSARKFFDHPNKAKETKETPTIPRSQSCPGFTT